MVSLKYPESERKRNPWRKNEKIPAESARRSRRKSEAVVILAARFCEKYRMILRAKWRERSGNTVLGGDDIVNGFEGSGLGLMQAFSDIRETSCRDEFSVFEHADTI